MKVVNKIILVAFLLFTVLVCGNISAQDNGSALFSMELGSANHSYRRPQRRKPASRYIRRHVVASRRAKRLVPHVMDLRRHGLPDLTIVTERAEYEKSREQMIKEVYWFWNMWLSDQGSSHKDKRRKNLLEYASYLVNAVLYYTDMPTDIGGQFVRGSDAHLQLGSMITFESSLLNTVTGSRGEVGLSQLMPGGPAVKGIRLNRIAQKPILSIVLGARLLAYSVGQCGETNVPESEWSDELWHGPVSLYASRPRTVIRSDGTCRRLKLSHRRVRRMMRYRAKVNMAISSGMY